MQIKTKLTNEEFETMAPRLGSCELIDGEIVPMAPGSFEHGEVEVNIGAIIRSYVRKKHLGRVAIGETGMHIREGTTRAADVTFVSFKRAPKDASKFLREPPELVAEVKSDNTTWKDIEKKVRDYHEFGVDVVWVADRVAETVRVYPKVGKPFTIPKEGEIDGGEILPGFRVKIAEFFSME